MCGIVGYIGQREALPVLMDGLKRLEYRGYDSAGVAVVGEARPGWRSGRGGSRTGGGAHRLAGRKPRGHRAHARWATHGRPSNRRPPPHRRVGPVAVVHNGIIENYAELRDELARPGYVFRSETDTEVIAHLIASHYDGRPVRGCAPCAAGSSGAYALAVVSRAGARPDRGRQVASPLVIGLGEGEHFWPRTFRAAAATPGGSILEEGDAVLTREGVA